MKDSVDQLLQHGIAAHKARQIQDAEQFYRSILQKEPNHADANHNLGTLIVESGKTESSIGYFETALEANPKREKYWLSLIDALIKVGQFDNATKIVRQGQNSGLKGEKLDQLTRQLKLETNAPAKKQLDALIALYDQGQLTELIKQANALLINFPQAIDLHNILGAANAGLKRFNRAIKSYQRAIQINSNYAEAHNNLGVALENKDDLTGAIESYQRAIKINPDYAEAHNNLGAAFQQKGNLASAIKNYYSATKIAPNLAEPHQNLANALLMNGDLAAAIKSYKHSLKIMPDLPEVHSNLGVALIRIGDLPKAIESFECALKIEPAFASAFVNKLHQQFFICDWDTLKSDSNLIPDLGISTDFIDPLPMLALEDHPARHLKRSTLFAKHKCREKNKALPALAGTSQNPDRIRIGYFSGDFHEHPVMRLIIKMFELHDRSTFEIQAFSHCTYNNDGMHKRLIRGFDSFHDVSDMLDKDIAGLARTQGIDIAIDLTGYTQKTRPCIFAYRAAPIQVSYLGYPGSMGADFIDYLIADHILIPKDHQKFYTEKIVYMPDCYQISDNSRRPSKTKVTRSELGLPEIGFVFCCFNNNFKITPREFDIWMRLLSKVESSVLWLRKSNKWSEPNLRTEAQARGIDPNRLIFSSKCAYSEYLTRLTKADLFLDTFNYNAGAVANDALWCGLPVLTLQGQSYTARMASSLLTAIDLPELITTNEEDYERLALDLATNSKKLTSIKARLAVNNDRTSLFDTELFTKNLETAYKQIHGRYINGEQPDHLLAKQRRTYDIPPASTELAGALTQEQVNALIALYNKGQFEEVVTQTTALVEQFPQAINLHNILGAANAGLKRFDAAIKNYQSALLINPNFVDGHNNLGIALKNKGDLIAAIRAFNHAVQINPDCAEAYSNLGNALKEEGNLTGAIRSCNRAIAIKPQFAEAHNNLAIALHATGDLTGAIENCNRAIKINPDYAEAHTNLGNALQENGDPRAAIKSYNRALMIDPNYTIARSHRLRQQAFICDWEAIETDRNLFSVLGVSTGIVTPFTMLYLEDHPARHLKRSELFARTKSKGKDAMLASIPRPEKNPMCLKIGYFSGDFNLHPVTCLIINMLELHDRSAFEIHAFSFGPDNHDTMHARLIDGVDVFHDVREIPDKDIAELARSKGIDIAIDLTGYTQNGRWGILAYRPAPIQISYLGYPGTMGAEFIDYIIADDILIPDGNEQFYSEKIVYMPHCYQVSDNSRTLPQKDITRTTLGLPETGFIFCCFNTNYKITHHEFNIWMRLLDKVEDSVLWLLQSNKWSEKNLKRGAMDRGIDPARLIFAQSCEYSEYLVRLTIADLYLDTFTFNAGAIANDALWCGLPVLTRQGQGYVARMASSLLTAIDLPELITTNEDDYEIRALELASNSEKLDSIKARMTVNKNKTPLFDTERFTKNIESAYTQIYAKYFAGENPESIHVNEYKTH